LLITSKGKPGKFLLELVQFPYPGFGHGDGVPKSANIMLLLY
jgi:hypothetical protein